MVPSFVVDSITLLGPRARGAVVVSGSHGGITAAKYAAASGARGVIFNDAGVGKNGAGISGLAFLDEAGAMAATVGHISARIGDGGDTLECGVISHCNQLAARAGVEVGLSTRESVRAMSDFQSVVDTASFLEMDIALPVPRIVSTNGSACVVLLASTSQLTSGHDRDVIVTGSHGGKVSGRAVKYPVAAAFFNDAGVGKDEAGISRLSMLDDQGIAGVAVDYRTAEIGDAEDTFRSGLVSHVNHIAGLLAVEVGMPVRQAAMLLLNRATKH